MRQYTILNLLYFFYVLQYYYPEVPGCLVSPPRHFVVCYMDINQFPEYVDKIFILLYLPRFSLVSGRKLDGSIHMKE